MPRRWACGGSDDGVPATIPRWRRPTTRRCPNHRPPGEPARARDIRAGLVRRPTWDLAAVAVGVGTSAFLVRLLGPETYQDNLFAAAVFMAAAVPTAVAVRDRRALIPAIVLFGAGGVVHWAFFAFM